LGRSCPRHDLNSAERCSPDAGGGLLPSSSQSTEEKQNKKNPHPTFSRKREKAQKQKKGLFQRLWAFAGEQLQSCATGPPDNGSSRLANSRKLSK